MNNLIYYYKNELVGSTAYSPSYASLTRGYSRLSSSDFATPNIF